MPVRALMIGTLGIVAITTQWYIEIVINKIKEWK
jgi:hypothetical protein